MMPPGDDVVSVDGSMLEGGGQILRVSVALAAIIRRPIRIYNIRAQRSTPGLRPQHLKGIQLIAAMSTGSVLEGAQIGSTNVLFYPGSGITCREYSVDIQTAGSCTLLLQAALPCAIFARRADLPGRISSEQSQAHSEGIEHVECSKRILSLDICGGTDVPMAPPMDYIALVLFPTLMRHFGLDPMQFDESTCTRGFYPQGGGRLRLVGIHHVDIPLQHNGIPPSPSHADVPPSPPHGDVPPSPPHGDVPPSPSHGDVPPSPPHADVPPSPSHGDVPPPSRNRSTGLHDTTMPIAMKRSFHGIQLTQQGEVISVGIKCFTAGKLPKHVGKRMVQAAVDILHVFREKEYGGSRLPFPISIEEAHVDTNRGNGCGITIVAETSTGCLLGSSKLGEKGVPAENIGEAAAQEVLQVIKSGACVDDHIADQIIIFMALASSPSHVLVRKPLTDHCLTAIKVAEVLLSGDVSFSVTPSHHTQALHLTCSGYRPKRE